MSDRHLRRLGDDYGTEFLSYLPQGQAWPREPGTILDLGCRGLVDYYGFVDGRAADLLERESDPRIALELLPDWERNWGLPDPCYTAPQTVAERQTALVARMTLSGSQSRQFYIDFAAFLGYTISISEYRTFVCGIDRCGDSRVYGSSPSGAVAYFNSSFVRGYLPVCDPLGNLLAAPLPPTPGVASRAGKASGTGRALGVSGATSKVGRAASGNSPATAYSISTSPLMTLSEYPNYGLGPPENRYYWKVHTYTADLHWFRCASGQCGVDPHLRIGRAQDLECILDRWKPAHTHIVYDYTNLHPGDPMEGTP